MKWFKFFGLIAISCLTVVTIVYLINQTQVDSNQSRQIYSRPFSQETDLALSTPYTETCLDPTAEYRPTWECYDISVSLPAGDEVVIGHNEGDQHRVLTFSDNGQTKFRFTPTKSGLWIFSTGGKLEIQAERPTYAKGFVAAGANQKWLRTATGEAFVPQFVMYDQADLDQGVEEFVEGHGFTGLHIQNLRDFTKNPSYFEAAVLKTYRQGGVTHFWIWGDESRQQTPDTYGVDVEQLYKDIAARLAPIPGWTYSYGFDLFEWTNAEELETFRSRMSTYTTYTHLFGARGHTQSYEAISPNLDYVAWEWRRPVYQDYRNHLEQANGRPVSSEDRFRIRTPSRYPDKDYNPQMTRKGLWYSMMSGGVANIWGYRPLDKEFSQPYPNKSQIKTYSLFTDRFYGKELVPDNTLIESGYCLKNGTVRAICYAEDTAKVNFNLTTLQTPLSIRAIDTQQPYEEIVLSLSNSDSVWVLPYVSDWAFALGENTKNP
jgi:hypothetical protein